MIRIYGKKNDAEEIAQLYSNLKQSLSLNEKWHWKAKVCKDQADECTQTIYYNTYFEDLKLTNCSTLHAGKNMPCPEERMDRYANSLKIPFPSCQKDDILELSYEDTITFPIRNRFWLPRHSLLESEYPAEKISLKLTIPTGMSIKQYSTQGVVSETSQDKERTSFVWQKNFVEPYKIEPFMPSLREVLARVTYSSLKSWDEVEDWENQMFKEAINPKAVNNTVLTIVSPDDSREKKIRKLYEWVRNNIRYEQKDIGFSTGYQPNDAGECLNYKFGDCKDQASLLTSMLNAAGIEAYPAMVSYRDITLDIPNPSEFYHVITAVPEGDGYIWLDSTCSACPYNYIPPEEQGVDVLILSDSKSGFTKTITNLKDKNSFSEINYTVVLNQNGTGLVDAILMITGAEGVFLRDGFGNINRDELKVALKHYVHDVCSDFDVINYTILNSTEVDVFTLELEINCKALGSKNEGRIIINLGKESLFSDIIDKEERRFQIIFESSETYASTIKIRIPEGYTVELLPEDYSKKEYFGGFSFHCTADDTVVSCMKEKKTNEIKIPPRDFNLFKDFYKDVNSKEKTIIFSPTVSEAGTVNDEKPQSNATHSTLSTTPLTAPVSKSQPEEIKPSAQGSNSYLLIVGVILALVLAFGFYKFRQKRG